MPENTFHLVGDVRELERSLEDLRRDFEELNKTTEKTEKTQKKVDAAWIRGAKAASKLAAGVTAAALATKAFLDGVTDSIDEVNTLAASTGLANEEIAGLRFAALSTGKSLTDLVPGELAKKLADAANNSAEAVRVFDQLDIKTTDAKGGLRSVSDVLPELIDKLGAMESPTEKAALAALLLGEQGKQMLSAFGDSEDLERVIAAAQEFGVDVGPEAVATASKWQQANAELALSWENLQQTMVDAGAFDRATQFIKNLALGGVFLTEVFRNLVIVEIERFGKVWDAIERRDPAALLESITDAGIFGFNDFQDAVGRSVERTQAFWELQQTGAEGAAKAIQKTTPPVVQFEGAVRDAEAAVKAAASATDGLIGSIEGSESDLLTGAQQVTLEYIARIDAIQQLTADAGLQAAAELAAEERLVRDLAELEKEKLLQTSDRLREEEAIERQHLQNVQDLESAFLELRAESFTAFLEMSEEAAFTTLDAIGQVVTNLAEAEKERIEAQLEGTTETIDALRDERAQLEETLATTEGITDEQRAQTKARLSAIAAELEASKVAANGQRELIDEQNAMVLAADRLSRTAAIGQIAIDGARAFTGMVAFLAGIVGPAAPAVAAPIVGGIVTAQTAAVVTAPKPTLHDGGLLFGPTAPDERDVGGARVLGGEAGVVLNQRAVDMGALEQVDSLNRAQDLGGGDRPLVLANAGRAFGEAWVQQASTRGSAVQQVVGSPSGFINPHRRG